MIPPPPPPPLIISPPSPSTPFPPHPAPSPPHPRPRSSFNERGSISFFYIQFGKTLWLLFLWWLDLLCALTPITFRIILIIIINLTFLHSSYKQS